MSEPTPHVPPSGSPAAVTPTGPPASWVTTPPAVGEVITSGATGNSYTMGEKIGEGNFGLVYSCGDVWNNSLAAKVLKPLGPYDEVKRWLS